MMGIYVVVGASVLGVISSMLIAWSLWSRSQARKRAEQRRLVSGQYAAIPPTSPAPMMGFQPPAGHTVVAGPPAASPIPSMFHPPAGHTVEPRAASPIPSMFQPPAGHTVVAGPPGEFDDDEEVRTEFMSSGQLFGQAEPPDEPTQFLTAADLFGVEEPEEVDEEEIATAFMSTDELFGRRTDATVVLSEDAIMPEPPAPAPAPAPAPRGPTAPVKPAPAPRYTGFVGDRADDRDDDDDLDDGDPETELVHQAELLRLITPSKRSE
jgi:hypothetical protein